MLATAFFSIPITYGLPAVRPVRTRRPRLSAPLHAPRRRRRLRGTASRDSDRLRVPLGRPSVRERFFNSSNTRAAHANVFVRLRFDVSLNDDCYHSLIRFDRNRNFSRCRTRATAFFPLLSVRIGRCRQKPKVCVPKITNYQKDSF